MFTTSIQRHRRFYDGASLLPTYNYFFEYLSLIVQFQSKEPIWQHKEPAQISPSTPVYTIPQSILGVVAMQSKYHRKPRDSSAQ